MEIVVKEIQVKDILTKSNLPVADYSVNPYVGCPHACKYCYASFMKRFTGHDEPWGDFIDVKTWRPITDSSKYNGKELFICSVTDPYNQMEERFQRTRRLLTELRGSDAKLSIQTKSDLVLRDLELIKGFRNSRVGFSINTLDEDFRSDMDRAVSIERRINAMKAFHEAGVPTTCFISPIFPGITDVKAIIDRVMDICNLVWLENLNLRGAFKPVILDYISQKRPELVPLYHEIYTKNDRTYWMNLDNEIRDYSRANGLMYVVDDDSMEQKATDRPVLVNFFYHEQIKKSAKKVAEPALF